MLGLLLAGTVVFERAEPVEVRTGIVRLCTVQAPLLEVPDLAGRPPRPDAWREDRFARLYAMEFELETRGRERAEREDRGAMLVAVRAEPDDLLDLEQQLRDSLLSLGADAFARPLAGFQDESGAFSLLAVLSSEPSWACSRTGARSSPPAAAVYQRHTLKGPQGEIQVVGSSRSKFASENQVEKLCAGFLQAARGCVPEEIRTLPSSRELHEMQVEVEEANTLPKEVRREDLIPLPQGAQVSKKKAPGTWNGGSSTPDRAGGTYVDREVEWTVTTAPSSLPLELLARGAHVSRWSLRERTRLTGAHPRDEVRTSAVRTVAFVPVAPAVFPDESAADTLAIHFSAEQLREDVAEALDAASHVDGALLEAALRGEPVQDPQWLQSEGWMTVLCRDDGTAWFGLPPTAARSPVTNAAAFCAAMERMLP
ncbi:MAG TPA: hypothetical protein VFV75_11110, partial [Candidatus Polarisedimenticolaceae bacterium]|nr:hypothetical protein [Candidatus Polarisedimenticolaceae bacterium]